MTTLTEAEFDAYYTPRQKPNGDYFDYEDVVGKPITHVWTVVEAEDDDGRQHLIACPGFHVVNRIGYLLTERPWVTGDEDAYWFFDDRDPSELDDEDSEENENA